MTRRIEGYARLTYLERVNLLYYRIRFSALTDMDFVYVKDRIKRHYPRAQWLPGERLWEVSSEVLFQEAHLFSNFQEMLAEADAVWAGSQRKAPPGEKSETRVIKVPAGTINALKVLGLPTNSLPTLAELKKARNKLAKQYHPDLAGGSEKHMKEINNAYDLVEKVLEEKNENKSA